MGVINFIALVFFFLLPFRIEAFSVIADLSPNRVEIHSKFTGKKILVFGAIMEKVDNVLVIIHGPEKDVAIHKKIRALGLWTNGPKVLVNMVPLFFSFSFANHNYKETDKIFHGEFTPFPHITESSNEMIMAFRESRIRNSLYQFANKIEIINNRLFRGNIFLPHNIPKGQYVVEIVALNENRIVGIEAMPLFVVKTGLDARISELSYLHPVLYALIAIIGALFIGWLGFLLPGAVRAIRSQRKRVPTKRIRLKN